MTRRKRKILFWTSFGIFAVLALIIPLYSAGYRLDKNFNLTLTGGIFVVVPQSETNVYLDGKLIRTTGIFKNVFIQNLQPKKHTILVAKDGYWPWMKQLEVKESLVSEARAFMLPKDISGKVLLKGLFTKIKSLPEQNLLVLEEKRGDKFITNFFNPEASEFVNPKERDTKALSQNNENQTIISKTDSKNEVEIRLESSGSPNKLFAKALQNAVPYFLENGETLVIESQNKIKNFDFYPKRQDVVIFALKHGIFAIEIDGRKNGADDAFPKNFQPIYKGIDPDFALIEKKLYVLDKEVLYEIEL